MSFFYIKKEEKMIPTEEWSISADEVTIFYDQKIGEGNFAAVYLGEWRGLTVAVKIFKHARELSLAQLEYETMSRLSHPNIIQMLGVLDSSSCFCIVMEYLPNGSLQDCHLKNLSVQQKKQFSFDLLYALAYLHNRKPTCFIHRDIKPSNILVDNAYQHVKIADFGLSKLVATAKHMPCSTNCNRDVSSTSSVLADSAEWTTHCGTLRYMAPELYHRGTPYDSKVDIFSAAMVLYTLWEEKTAYEDSLSMISSLDDFKTKITREHLRPSFHKSPAPVQKIIKAMWSTNPINRPTALECISLFTNYFTPVQKRQRLCWCWN